MLDGATRELITELARQVLRFRARVFGAAVLLVFAKVAAVTVPLVLKAIVDVMSRPEALAALPVFLLGGYAAGWRLRGGGWWPPFAIVALTLILGMTFEP